MLTVDVAGDVVHRAGAVQRHDRDDVLEPVGLKLAQHVAHARTFKLEHAGRIAAAQHLECLRILQRDRRQVDLHAARADQPLRHRQDGERLQPKEVELNQPRRFDIFHVELGDRHVGARIAVQRHQLVQRPVADHHAGGMGGGVAVQPFQLQPHGDHLADGLVLIALALQFRLAGDGLGQRYRVGRVVRHQLADAVHLAIGQLQDAPDIAQHRAGLQLTEGDDLRDLVGAVFALHVADDLVAPLLTEIDIEVRHGDAFGIQEPLEQQVPAQRVEIGDGQCPGDHRTGTRTAARPDRNPLVLRPLDEVGDDQEVAREAHLVDHVQLEIEPLAIGFRRRLAGRLVHLRREDMHRQPPVQPGHSLHAQFAGLVPALAGIVGRQDWRDLLRKIGAAAGDLNGVIDSLRQIGEQRAHLGG